MCAKRARTRSQRMWAFLVGNRSSSLLNRSLLLVSASADWWDKCDVVRGLRGEKGEAKLSKKTYYCVKRDLLQCQTRPKVRRRPRTACRNRRDVRHMYTCHRRIHTHKDTHTRAQHTRMHTCHRHTCTRVDRRDAHMHTRHRRRRELAAYM